MPLNVNIPNIAELLGVRSVYCDARHSNLLRMFTINPFPYKKHSDITEDCTPRGSINWLNHCTHQTDTS